MLWKKKKKEDNLELNSDQQKFFEFGKRNQVDLDF